MMKKQILAVCAAAALLGASAAEESVVAKQSAYRGWGENELDLGENLSLSNSLNLYTVTLAQWKAKGNSGPQFQLWMFEPREYGGFSRPIMDFLRITVNGISEIALQPRKENIKPWSEGDRTGFETTLNFDGTKILLRFFLRPDSPVLWCTLKPGEGSVEPVKSVQIQITAIPSKFAKDAKGGVVWNGGYAREGVTAARTISQGPDGVELNDGDRWIILQDKVFDGTSDEKGGGPCVVIPGKAANGVMKAVMRDSWVVNLKADLPADFKEYTFGFWTRKNRVSNAETLEIIKASPEAFQEKK